MCMTPKEKLGANIRMKREELGYSQEKLASVSGIHRTYMGSVERGERNISLENIVAISRALGCSVSELLKGVE